ncbi:MAG: hypothetical protein SGBAC_007105 [Bacillariaceae sp.]
MDPPGHTVFLYLQELNRAELQKQAKVYGIKANQKSEVLRLQLQEVLVAKDNVKSPPVSVTVVEDEGKNEEVVEVESNGIIEANQEEEVRVMAPTIEKEEENEEKEVQPNNPSVQEGEEKDQVKEAAHPEATNEKERDASTTVNEMESKYESSAWMEGEDEEEEKAVQESAIAKPDETENEESTAAVPPQITVDLASDEMVDLADESIVSPTTAAKEMFRSKLPTGPSTRRKVLGERSSNARNGSTSKLGKLKRQFQPIGSVSKIIRRKNSPTRRPTSQIPRKPILETKAYARPKAMPLSRRNELQLQKFVERQNRGRKNREEQLRRVEFANLVKSPGKAK